MSRVEEFVAKSVIGSVASTISTVLHGEIGNEEAVLLLAKTPFAGPEVEKVADMIVSSEHLCTNDIYNSGRIEIRDWVKYTLIHPATPEIISKYRGGKKLTVHETPKIYREWTLPTALSQSPSCQWIENLFSECQGQKAPFASARNEPVHWIDEEFLIVSDIKWDRVTRESLYLLVLFRDPSIYTIRELRASHIPLLKRILASVEKILEAEHSMLLSDVKIYFHYYPTFFRAHAHVAANTMSWPAESIGLSVLLHDVIENLSISSTYYADRTMEVLLSTKSHLYIEDVFKRERQCRR